jgi:hypothetical protein
MQSWATAACSWSKPKSWASSASSRHPAAAYRGKKLLEQIDRLLPSGPEAADVDVDTVRGRLHEELLHPTATLVEQSQQLLASAASSERASIDLERQLGATRKLLVLVQQLALPAAPATEASERAGFERVFNRLRPSPQTAIGALNAGTCWWWTTTR